jgi:ATP-dependent protease ClpP protease subunit
MNEIQPFYRFRAEAAENPTSAELLIFAAIGDWDELGEVSAQAFARDLSKLPSSVKRLDIHINSPGGSVSEANGIYSRLADHRSDKHVYIDGLAASAATIVAMVGHKIYIRAHATMMIHLPSALAMGNADDMRMIAAALDSHTEAMLNIYAKRTKLDREELRSLMAAETWFSPQQAVEKGFADEMRGVVKAAATIEASNDKKIVCFNGLEFDLSKFRNVPAFTATTEERQKPMSKTKVKNDATAGGAADDDNGNGNADEGKEKQQTPPAPTPPTPPPQTPPKTGEQNTDAVATAVQAERDRVNGLLALDRPATHDIVMAAIKDGKQVSDVVAECMEAMDKASKQNARRVDAHQLDGLPPANGADDDDNFGALLTKKVKSRLRNRGQRTAQHSRN